MDWPAINQTAKPWTRWWWQGNSVTKEGITAELEAYQKAGIGGLELTPIYGVIGEEENFIDYLSPQWLDLFEHTLQEAERLGMGVDMATGTGWPFGGPWIGAEDACKNMTHKKYELSGGQRLTEPVQMTQEPFVRAVTNQVYQLFNIYKEKGEKLTGSLSDPLLLANQKRLKITDLVEPISANPKLQELALDQVRFEKKMPLQSLMAFSENGETIDLTQKVNSNGLLDWTAPEGQWNLYAVFQGWHGKMVERAAPGGEGNVIDHFANAPIEHYLTKFDEAFAGRNIQTLRAFFNDSYEVDDARGQGDWTPNLFAAFKAKRGYDLQAHLPALFGDDSEENNHRVLSDYRETISDLLLETFTQKWAAWAKKNNAIVRNQAHGSPSNILDLYAASDIPETEGTDIIRIKMASSAAHVAGRPLASAEAATWLNEHFLSNLSDVKENIDRYLLGGINHVFFHGTCYSPPGEEWPGRLFYAAIHANPRNPLWHDFPTLNEYIARSQSFLQTGQPDNDVLLYFPIYDRFATPGPEMLEHFDGNAKGKEETHVRTIAEMLQGKGFGFDFISDKQINLLEIKDGKIKSGNIFYKSIIIPDTKYIPLPTLKKILEMALAGAPIIFQNKLPESVPGLNDLENRKNNFNQLIASLKDKVIIGNDLAASLENASIYREQLVDTGLEFTRRRHENGAIYFISNWSEKNYDSWMALAGDAKSVIIYDPMTGQYGLAKTRTNNKGKLELLLQLNKGASVILKTFNKNISVENWHYLKKKNAPVALNGKWTLTFLEGGPELPPVQELNDLKRWTDLNNEACNKFSGTANYSINFPKPTGDGSGWLLDLGEVSESATVHLNGKKIGTAIGPVYQLFIPNELMAENNKLEIAVTNLMANRIIDLEKRGVFWKKFYNVNFPARRAENRGADGLFTAEGWKPKPSGLAGPVTFTMNE